jgi:hypothetical protein
LELAGIIIGFVNNSMLEELVLDSMKLYGENEVVKSGWDTLQTEFNCCGYNSAADWGVASLSNIFSGTGLSAPSSCSVTSLTQGCKDALTGYFIIIAGVAIAVLFVEFMAMIFACCLSRSVGKDRYA